MPRHLLLLIAGLMLLYGTAATAQSALPSRASVEKQISTLEKQASPDPAEQARLQALRDTLGYLDERASNEQQLKDIAAQQAQAPHQLEEVRQSLQQLERDAAAEPPDYSNTDINGIVRLLSDKLDRLEQLQEQLAETSSALINYQTLPEQTQTALRQALQQVEAVRQRISRRNDPNNQLSDARVTALQAQREALNSRIDVRQRELWGSNTGRRLAAARQQLQQLQVQSLTRDIAHLQQVLNDKRKARTESLIAGTRAELPEELASDPALNQVIAENHSLSEQVMQASERTNALIRSNIEMRTQLDQLRQTERNLHDQIETLKGSLILSRILYSTQKNLPHIETQRNLNEQISEARLQQYRLNQQQADQPPIHAEALSRLSADNDKAEPSAELVAALETLLKSRNELRNQLDNELGRFLNLAIGLQVGQEQLKDISDGVRATIREQSFWMPSNQMLDSNWWRNMPAAIITQLKGIHWRSFALPWQQLRDNGQSRTVPLLLLAFLLWLRRSYWKRQLDHIEADIGRVRQDSQAHTPRALLLDLLLEAPVPILMATVAVALLSLTPPWLVTADMLLRLALLWLVFALCLRLLRRDGLTEKHFHWPPEESRAMRRWLVPVTVGMIVPALVSAVEVHHPELLPDNTAAMVGLMVSAVLLTVGLFQLMRHYPLNIASPLLKRLLIAVTAMIPLSLLMMTWIGYFYTAVKLSGRLMESFLVLVLWALISQTVVRGLAVAARKLRFKRILARRQAREKESGESSEAPPEEPPLDMAQVNQQSLRLTRLALLAGLIVALYLIWSDLLGAFSYTDNIVLWTASLGDGVTVPISLGDLVTALVTAGITLALARNLPGLLEVLVLSRLSLRPGSAYAITTLLSYVILASGLLTALSTIGFAWSKLQWLVAALGVGLGFGLQEIFANFVSGLIILFERPARIGDVITIGDLSGTVSRIRIRATTITDFERKEIIIPNKSFVTDRLINWSLTDSITRITITVGFAYGSDLDKAYEVLMRAAQESPYVLRDPEPVVVFMTFGASTLDHELRVHVQEVMDRIPATHDLNRRVDALCREAGLEIAFSQLDIHIRNDANEIRLVDSDKR